MSSVCSPESCRLLKDHQSKFLSVTPINKLNWDELFNHLIGLDYSECIEHQRSLLDRTVKNSLTTKYPLRSSYITAFLKALLKGVEDTDLAHPDIFDLYIDRISSSYSSSSSHYRHFLISEKYVSIQESTSIISQGTTGLCVWEGALALADWCISNSKFLEGKNVIELGCGVGFTGLAISCGVPSLQSYLLTDCHQAVLSQCERNLKLNSIDSKLRVALLDWNNYQLSDTFDVVLAADVVYDSELFQPFCQILSHLLKPKGNVAVLACTVRREDTLSEFLTYLEKSQFAVERREWHPNILSYALGHYSVNIYVVTEKR